MQLLRRSSLSLVLFATAAASLGCGDKGSSSGAKGSGSGSALVGSAGSGSGSSAGSGSAVTPAAPTYTVPTQARAVGGTRTVTSAFTLQGTVTPAGGSGSAAPTTLDSKEQLTWTDTIAAVSGDVVTALDVAYQPATAGDGKPSPLAGSSYRVALDEATQKITVTRTASKAKLAAAEHDQVALAFADDVGVPALVGRVLGGTAFEQGKPVTLPGSALTSFISMKDAVGTAFSMTLTELSEQRATFVFAGDATVKIAGADVTLKVKGTMVTSTTEGWVQSLESSGELSASGPVGLAGTFTATQTMTYGTK